MKQHTLKLIIVTLTSSILLSACNNGSSKYNNPTNSLVNNSQNTSQLNIREDNTQATLKICVVNGSMSTLHTVTMDNPKNSKTGTSKMLLMPGEIRCNYLVGSSDFRVTNDTNDTVYYNYNSPTKPQPHPSIIDAIEMYADMLMQAISLGLGVETEGIASTIFDNYELGPVMGLFEDTGATYLQHLTGIYVPDSWKPYINYAKDAYNLLNNEDPSAIAAAVDEATNNATQYISELNSSDYDTQFKAIGGTYIPNASNSSGTHLLVLGGHSNAGKLTPGQNPFQWVEPLDTKVNNCQDSLQCQLITNFTVNKYQQVLSMMYTMHEWSAYNDQGYPVIKEKYVPETVLPSDAVYLCVLDSTQSPSGVTNCSNNDGSMPLDYSMPNKDDNGVAIQGGITFTNNTASPVMPYLVLSNNPSDKKPTTAVIAGPFVPANQSYTFTQKSIAEKGNYSWYSVQLQTSNILDTPQMLPCSFPTIKSSWASYGSTWEEQRVFANYNFTSPVNGWGGPYKCEIYTSSQITDSKQPFWTNYAVRPWNNIIAAQKYFTNHTSNTTRIQAWVPNWENTTFSLVNDLDPGVDDIYYAFAIMNETGTVISSSEYNDFAFQDDGSMGKGMMDAAIATGRSVYLGVGGWENSESFSTAIANNQGGNIMTSISSLIDRYNQDAAKMGVTNKLAGVNIDWEPNANDWTMDMKNKDTNGNYLHVVTKADLQTFLTSMHELSQMLASKGMKLNISITQNPMVMANIDATWGGNYFGELSKIMDTLNVMTYDYHAATWGGIDNQVGDTNFNSPLRYSPNQAFDNNGYFKTYNVDSSLSYLMTTDSIAGSKIIMGIPAYGYAYPVAKNNYGAYIKFNNNPTALNEVIGLETKDSSIISYKAIYYNQIANAWFDVHTSGSALMDPDAVENYTQGQLTQDQNNNVWISFDNNNSAALRMQYAKSKNLAGVMLWEANQDLPTRTTLQINQTNKSSSKQSNPNSILSGLLNGK